MDYFVFAVSATALIAALGSAWIAVRAAQTGRVSAQAVPSRAELATEPTSAPAPPAPPPTPEPPPEPEPPRTPEPPPEPRPTAPAAPRRDAVPSLHDLDTPVEVRIRTQARIPEADPTLGVRAPRPGSDTTPWNRLVILGDSLSLGLQSLGVNNPAFSYPAIIASELGCYGSFLQPAFDDFEGLPLNLEYVTREMESRQPDGANWWKSAELCTDYLLSQVRQIREYGPSSAARTTANIVHNLAIPGCDVRDLISTTADTVAKSLKQHDDGRSRRVTYAGDLLALRVLASARHPDTGTALAPVDAAIELGNKGGIETLIVFIGVSNALGSVVELCPKWSGSDYSEPNRKSQYNIWRPSHFESELKELVEKISKVKARHVIWATVPHVTILPIARGVRSDKIRQGSRYFAYYTRPWISDEDFNPDLHPHMTANQARAIDSAIDQYNDAIGDEVRNARWEERDWLLLDVAGILDRLATRRYVQDERARPTWWIQHPLPEEVEQLTPTPDTRFFTVGPEGRIAGGLFSLDGVHLTTIAYAMLAQEFIKVMQDHAGIEFRDPHGRRRERVQIDFSRVIAHDTLISRPPPSMTPDLEALAWADERLDWVAQLARPL